MKTILAALAFLFGLAGVANAATYDWTLDVNGLAIGTPYLKAQIQATFTGGNVNYNYEADNGTDHLTFVVHSGSNSGTCKNTHCLEMRLPYLSYGTSEGPNAPTYGSCCFELMASPSDNSIFNWDNDLLLEAGFDIHSQGKLPGRIDFYHPDGSSQGLRASMWNCNGTFNNTQCLGNPPVSWFRTYLGLGGTHCDEGQHPSFSVATDTWYHFHRQLKVGPGGYSKLWITRPGFPEEFVYECLTHIDWIQSGDPNSKFHIFVDAFFGGTGNYVAGKQQPWSAVLIDNMHFYTGATAPSPGDVTPPTVPSGLTASVAASLTAVDLAWNASTDAVGVDTYHVRQGGTIIATNAATVRTLHVTGLTPGQTYGFTVDACDATPNCSAQSGNVNAVMTDTIAPTAPTGLSFVNASTTEADLFWNGATDAIGVTGYRAYMDGNQIYDGGACTFAKTGLTPGATYIFTTKAYDAAGNLSVASNSVSDTMSGGGDVTAPTVPTGLAVAIVTPTSMRADWNASTDAVGVAGYNLSLNGLVVFTGASRTATIAGLTPGATEVWNVNAFDTAGNVSANSADVSMLLSDVVAPTAPTGLNVTPGPTPATTVNAIWSAATDLYGVTGYKVYRDGNLVQDVGDVLTFADTGLTVAHTYSYTVKAYDAAANLSAASAAATITTAASADVTAPSQPTGLSIMGVASNALSFHWTASTDNVAVTGYRIKRDGTIIATISATQYADLGLTPSTSYTYTVTALDAAGNTSVASSNLVQSTSTSQAGVLILTPLNLNATIVGP